MYNHDSFFNLKDIDSEFTKNIYEKKDTPPYVEQKAENGRRSAYEYDEFKAAVLITAMLLKREGF